MKNNRIFEFNALNIWNDDRFPTCALPLFLSHVSFSLTLIQRLHSGKESERSPAVLDVCRTARYCVYARSLRSHSYIDTQGSKYCRKQFRISLRYYFLNCDY